MVTEITYASVKFIQKVRFISISNYQITNHCEIWFVCLKRFFKFEECFNNKKINKYVLSHMSFNMNFYHTKKQLNVHAKGIFCKIFIQSELY